MVPDRELSGSAISDATSFFVESTSVTENGVESIRGLKTWEVAEGDSGGFSSGNRESLSYLA
jgi:hypothetical protein